MVKVTSFSIILSSALTQKKKMGITGSIGIWVGSSPPAGALFCDGTTYNTADYPGLAASLGASGATFIIPDLRTMMPLGTTSNIRQTGGDLKIQSINHEHTALASKMVSVNTTQDVELGDEFRTQEFRVEEVDLTTTQNTTDAQINYLPPYLAVNFIIYT